MLRFEPMTYGRESECATHYAIAPRGMNSSLSYVTMYSSYLLKHGIVRKTVVRNQPGAKVEDGCVAEEDHRLHKREGEAEQMSSFHILSART